MAHCTSSPVTLTINFVLSYSSIRKLDESYPCKLVPSTRRTRNSGLPSRTLSSKMFAKSYPRRVVPATGRTLKLVPYFNIISTVNWGDIEHFFHTYTCVSHLSNNSFICKYNVIVRWHSQNK